MVWPRHCAWIGVGASVLALLAAALLVGEVASEGQTLHLLGAWEGGLGIRLRADPLAASLLLMSNLVALASGWYATRYFSDAEQQSRFWPLWLLLIAALNAMLLSADLFNLYVTLELLGLSAAALAALGGGRAAVAAALRYLMLGLLGSMAFLAGVTLVYARYGVLDMLLLAPLIEADPASWLALALMSAGLLLKSALFPLHFWLPPAHANAPAPVSAALSALVVKAAFYLLLRLWLDLFQPAINPAASWLLGLLGAAAVLWGSWNALLAVRLKLLAAYSTVAQIGYLFIFFPLLAALPAGAAHDAAFGALLLMALTHGCAKSALFLAAGVIQKRVGHDRIEDLGGTARTLPVTTFAIALAGVALIGLPPSGAFLAKWQLLSSAFALGQWLWIPVVALGSLLAAAYIFRILSVAFGPGTGADSTLIDAREAIPPLLLAVLATAFLGFGGALVWHFAAPAAMLEGAL
jgi:formate hydrogenlyase subunit 3/multisubunit Na+/H+ antiporter MnhD subunit